MADLTTQNSRYWIGVESAFHKNLAIEGGFAKLCHGMAAITFASNVCRSLAAILHLLISNVRSRAKEGIYKCTLTANEYFLCNYRVRLA